MQYQNKGNKQRKKIKDMKKKKIYQIEVSNENGRDLADGLFSWQVFKTKEDAYKWLELNAFEDYYYEVVEYNEDDIEDYEFVEV